MHYNTVRLFMSSKNYFVTTVCRHGHIVSKRQMLWLWPVTHVILIFRALAQKWTPPQRHSRIANVSSRQTVICPLGEAMSIT